MDGDERLDRRTWLTKVGITSLGVSGTLLALRHGGRIGAVTPRAAAGGAPSRAARVNLGFVSAYVVARGNAAAIVDTGVANSADRIGEVLRATGLDWRDVHNVILTHWHPDHSGSAAEVLARASQALLWVGEADVERVQVPQPIRPATDGAEIFGLRVVATPGHTLGHISLFDAELGALFIGDAAVNGTLQVIDGMPRIDASGGLMGSLPQATADMDLARASIRRIAGLVGLGRAYFGHGEPIDGGAAAAFRRLAGTM